MTTTPPTTTETTAGSNVVAAYVARLEWELEQDLKDGSSRTTFPTLALRAVVNDYRTLQRELAASREREARLRQAGELVCERILPLLDIRSNLTFDPTALERAVERWDAALAETEAPR